MQWLALREVDDEAPTFVSCRLVQLKPSIRPELLDRIAEEGAVVYEDERVE